MRITIQNESDVVFEFDGKTLTMPTDQIHRSFVFYALIGSLSALCNIPLVQEIPDEEPGTVKH